MAAEPKMLRDRYHAIVEYAEAPGRREADALEAAGALVLGYVPDTGLLIAPRRGARVPATGWIRAEVLTAKDKLSPRLNLQAAGEQDFVFLAEFHPDVRAEEARQIALIEGLSIREHPDLAGTHLLLEGPAGRMKKLAEWDETAYLFPASQELMDRRPAYACAGALSDAGGIGQYVSRIGEGWDGPGRNAARLQYSFERLTEALPRDVLEGEIARAMREWARHVRVDFAAGGDRGRAREIAILFTSGAHGDPFPFDGRGRTLAHTFFPAPPNPEPIAGDMHLDEEENWQRGADIDVYSVVLHELGHALGLGHSDNPEAVMYAYYRRAQGLTEEDIAAIQTMYAAREPEKPEEPPQPPPEPTPDAPPVEALRLAITSPAAGRVRTEAVGVALAGTTAGGYRPVRVRWESDRGPSGAATGERDWRTGTVPLSAGLNVVKVTAQDAKGKQAQGAVTLERIGETGKGTDRSSPSLTITFPGMTLYQTSHASITIRGMARDDTGVAQVLWQSNNGFAGTATGSTNWAAENVPLLVGTNTIMVRARDLAGKEATRAVMIVRR